MEEKTYDVIIVGAGPAGCSCAIALNQANLKVCLVDDVSGITFKEGESLPGAAIRLLNRLGISSMEELLPCDAFAPCVGNVSSWGSEQWIHNDAILNPEGGGWHLNRVEFDKALRKRALSVGVDYYHSKVGHISTDFTTGIAGKIHRVELTKPRAGSAEPLLAKWIVDATGRKSAISRKLSVKKNRLNNQMAALCWLKPDRDDKDNTTRIKSTAQGWWYSARLPDRQRVLAFFGLPGHIAELTRKPADFFELCNASNLLPYAVSQADALCEIKATDAGVSKLQSAGGDGWIAVGDAVLANDPLSSQGIFFALYSGFRGAEAILASENNAHVPNGAANAAAIVQYQQQIDSVFQANQKARKYHYSSEWRFITNSYWQQSLS